MADGEGGAEAIGEAEAGSQHRGQHHGRGEGAPGFFTFGWASRTTAGFTKVGHLKSGPFPHC